jgi:hypothetical protein
MNKAKNILKGFSKILGKQIRWDNLLNELLERKVNLTDSDKDFLLGLTRQHKNLSDKQIAWLLAIRQKIRSEESICQYVLQEAEYEEWIRNIVKI